MKKFLSLVLAVAMLTSLVVGVGSLSANAAYKKYTYKIVTKQKPIVVNGTETGADFHYQLVKVDGNTDVIKKINNKLKAGYTNYVKSVFAQFKYCVENDVKNGRDDCDSYYATIDSKITCNKGKYFSIAMTDSWYAGGVSNHSDSGITFSKKTGKALKLSNVLSGTRTKITARIVNALAKKYKLNASRKTEIKNILKKYKLSDYKFYITNKTVVVCFSAYEILSGGTGQTVTLKR